jgi:hypothetical protein
MTHGASIELMPSSSASRSAAASPLPMFRFGVATDAAPLAIVAGGLILDLGEAERTFIYRCQDRFLAYTSLWGLRSVFFAATDRHVEIYRRHIDAQRARYDRIRDRTGLFAGRPLLEPLYVGCDLDELRLFACSGFAEQAKQLAPSLDLAMNQISPTYAELLAQLAGLLRQQGIDVEGVAADSAKLAVLTVACADKSDYLALTVGDPALPAHVPTALFGSAELAAPTDYRSLVAEYLRRIGGHGAAPARLFVKAARNSSGNLSALVDPGNFSDAMRQLRATLAREAAIDGAGLDEQAAELRKEVDAAPCLHSLGLSIEQLRRYKRSQAALRQHVDFLVQSEVRRRDGDTGFGGIGLSFMLDEHGSISPLGATAQLYRDCDNKHFQGAYLSDAIDRDIPMRFHQGMRELCRRYAARGYRGPINFDARRDDAGQYQLIYDCNPRLTGVLASLAVRDALRACGSPVRSVLTLGYRGEFVLPDLDAALSRLDRAGLLCTQARARGVVMLPNLSRENGFDLHLSNIDPDQANRLLDGELGALSAATVHPQRLYW